jgi:hypothetical protein
MMSSCMRAAGMNLNYYMDRGVGLFDNTLKNPAVIGVSIF